MASKTGFERKHFFIDRSFQGRYMLTFLVPMLVMLLFMLFTLYIASQSIISTTASIIKEDVENAIATGLQDRASPAIEDYQTILTDIKGQLRTFSTNARYRKALMTSLLLVFGAGVLVVIIEIVVLTIFFSHKVAGPVYRFERICHKVVEGDYTENVRLRKGDDLVNLGRLLDDVIQKSRQRLIAVAAEPDPQKREELIKTIKL